MVIVSSNNCCNCGPNNNDGGTVANETPLVVTSPNGSVTILQSGTNGHTLQLSVPTPTTACAQLAGQPNGTAGVFGSSYFLGPDCQFHLLPAVTVNGAETPLAVSSPDGSISVVQSGTSLHSVQLTVNLAAKLSALPIGVPAVFGASYLLGNDGQYHLLPAVPATATETPLAVSSPDGSITIVQSGTNGHTLQLSTNVCNALSTRPTGAAAARGTTLLLGNDCQYHLLPALTCTEVASVYTVGTVASIYGQDVGANCVKEDLATALVRMLASGLTFRYLTTGTAPNQQKTLQVKITGQPDASYQAVNGAAMNLIQMLDCNGVPMVDSAGAQVFTIPA